MCLSTGNFNQLLAKFLFSQKNLTLLFLILVSTLVCSEKPEPSLNQQIESIVNSENVIKDRYGRVVFLKSEVCLEKECDTYFEEVKNQVFFYSKSEIFIYNFKGYLEIESIDENSIEFKKVSWN